MNPQDYSDFFPMRKKILKLVTLNRKEREVKRESKMKKSIIITICLIVALTLLAVPIMVHLSAPSNDVERAIENAINFFEESNQQVEPYPLLMLDVIYRRFGIEEFSDSLELYDLQITNLPHKASILRVFRRIADYNNQLKQGDLEAVWDDVDQLTVPALYCNRNGLPTDYQNMFERAVSYGGGYLTHALLAWIWIQENGGEMALSEDYIEEMYSATAELINDDSVVIDEELEAAAFLYIAGQGDLVDDSFVARTLETQNKHGGWFLTSADPDLPSWHATSLALLFLLHIKFPANSYPPMLDPA